MDNSMDDFLDFKTEEEPGFGEMFGKITEEAPGVEEVEDIFQWQAELGENYKPLLRQCVASFDVGKRLNLSEITAKVRPMNYNPRRFNSAEVTLTRPPAKLKIAASGKCIILGCKKVEDCEKAAKKTAVLLRLAGVKDAVVNNYRITNMTLSVDLKVPIRLGELHKRHSQMCTYEPSIFPGLRFNLKDPKCVASIFVNGKINITGLQVLKNATIVVEQLFPVLRPFMGAADGSHQELIDSRFGKDITQGYKPREEIKTEETKVVTPMLESSVKNETETQPAPFTPSFFASTTPILPPTMTPPAGPSAAPSFGRSPGLNPSTPGLSATFLNSDAKDDYFRLDDSGARSGSEDAMGGWGVDSFL